MEERISIRESQDGGGGSIAILLGLGAVGYFGYKYLNKNVMAPLQMKQDVQRMQLTQPKVGMDLKHKQFWVSFVINNPNNNPLIIRAITGVISVHSSNPNQPGFNVGEIDTFKPI